MEAHLVEALQNVLALHAEVALECEAVLLDALGLQHVQGQHLHGMRSTAIKVRAGLVQRCDQVARSNDPADAPPRTAPVLGQTVDKDDGRVVDVVDVLGCRHSTPLVTLMEVPACVVIKACVRSQRVLRQEHVASLATHHE